MAAADAPGDVQPLIPTRKRYRSRSRVRPRISSPHPAHRLVGRAARRERPGNSIRRSSRPNSIRSAGGRRAHPGRRRSVGPGGERRNQNRTISLLRRRHHLAGHLPAGRDHRHSVHRVGRGTGRSRLGSHRARTRVTSAWSRWRITRTGHPHLASIPGGVVGVPSARTRPVTLGVPMRDPVRRRVAHPGPHRRRPSTIRCTPVPTGRHRALEHRRHHHPEGVAPDDRAGRWHRRRVVAPCHRVRSLRPHRRDGRGPSHPPQGNRLPGQRYPTRGR
ncbi:hypothetical protein BKA25_000278 [Actinoalloteichus hymeniacidonis]|uniref:Uncharacterized protein n=1 Tax=Actinoalloteichus hymeniacidonis TaxID=340345 RepID=A0AAC9N199_9PSEU|nr:hypothetical protein TL08_25865 [Actinoalloteichus hymeniacidonis]MBB5905962.1 hypothetical protein [Actinoalloteichus hymeniacidonis]